MSAQTLEELIDQQINLGHKDPHEFPDLIANALGDELLEIVKPYLADFIAEMGRHRLGQLRRASVAKITPKSLADPEVMLQSMWVPEPHGPNITYKRIADMTAADFEARATYLEHMATGITRSAEWCRDCAKAIKRAKVQTAGQLGYLPPLPE
jgi:hypothetical protein